MAVVPSPVASGSHSSNLSPAKPPKLRHSFWWYLKWFFYTIALTVFCVVVAVASVGYGLYKQLEKIVPDARLIQTRTKAETTRIYAADGKTQLAEIKGEDRIWKPFSELIKDPKKWPSYTTPEQRADNVRNILKATLSIEDARFYRHPGMDAKRLAGAALANYKSGRAGQGGSTITEQLAVNLYQTRTKSVSRRLQAALLALQLEKRYSKDEILELYVNEIYYGNGAYGCEAASQIYFGKSSGSLSIGEAALLAGLPQRPSFLDPFDHFENAKKRQKIVLHEMMDNGFITSPQYSAATNDASVQRTIERNGQRRIREKRTPERWKYPYFVSYVKSYLKQYNIDEAALRKGGLKIITTIEPQLQEDAERALLRQLNRLGDKKLQGALVSIDPWSGHVLAMVGGRDYYDKAHNGEYNRAVQAKRQPGSTFKPYIYAAAMEAGYSPNDRVEDSTMRTNGYQEVKSGGREVRNYDRIHRGRISFLSAIGMSNNVAATRVMLKVGIGAVIQKAHLMGIQSNLVPYSSLALGSSEISLLEHVSGYGVFATRGLRAEPTPVERVESATGELLIDHAHPVRGARVMSAAAGDKMWQMLRYVVTNGTGQRANFAKDVIGKTGTTSANKDVWFMGATSKLSAGVWIGYDRPKTLAHGSAGGAWCAPVWRSYMEQATDYWNKRNKIEKMVEDARLTEQSRESAKQNMKVIRVRLCDETGLVATSACPSTRVMVYSVASGVPSETCYVHVPKATETRVLGQDYQPRAKPGDLSFDGSDEPRKPAPRTSPDDAQWLDQPAADAGERTGERNSGERNNSSSPKKPTSPVPQAEERSDVIIQSDGTRSRGQGNDDNVVIVRPGESAPAPRSGF